MKHIILAAGIIASAPAMAADTIHPYLGIQMHWTDADVSKSDILPGAEFSLDTKDSGYGVRAGVFNEYRAYDQMMGFVGAELGYVDLGEITASGGGVTASADATGMDLAVIGGTEVAVPNLYAYGRLGLFQWDSTAEASAGGLTLSEDDSGTDFVFGFGVMYFFDYIQVRGGFDRYRLDFDDDATNVDAWNIGAQISF